MISTVEPKTEIYTDILARFLGSLQFKGLSPLSIKTYGQGVRHYLAFLEEKGLVVPLESMTREHAREWLGSLQRAGLKETTVRGRHQACQQLFKLAIEDGEARENPFEGLPLPAGKLKDIQILSVDDVQALIDAAKRDKGIWSARDVALIALLYDGGFRASEIIAITEKAIDWKQGYVWTKGKGGRERPVSTGAGTLKALNRYLQARKKYEAGRVWWKKLDEDSPIWISHKGGALTTSGLREVLTRRGREARLRHKLHPHQFRHSAATALAEHMPEAELRAHFGWSPTSPQVYRYTRSSLQQRAIARHKRAAPSDKLRL